MRRLLIPIAIASTAFLQPLSFAQSVTTNPVGFNTITIQPNTIRALALPIDNIPAFTGPVSSRTATTIDTTNANFTVSYGPFSTNPHVIRVLSGASQGRQFRIASNDTDTLTLTPGTGVDLTTLIADGDRYEILAVETLGTLFGTASPAGLNTGGAGTADNVILREGTAYNTYFNDGTNWLGTSTGGTIQNNRPILPEQGFLFVRRAGTRSFTVTGAVPITKLVTDFPASRTTLFANRFPLNYKLTPDGATNPPTPGINFQAAANWNSNANFNLADFVQIRSGATYNTFYHNGSVWLRQGQEQLGAQNPTIGAGTSVVVTRRAGNPVVLDQALPYSVN